MKTPTTKTTRKGGTPTGNGRGAGTKRITKTSTTSTDTTWEQKLQEEAQKFIESKPLPQLDRRTYFAGCALTGLLVHARGNHEEIIKAAWGWADRMDK